MSDEVPTARKLEVGKLLRTALVYFPPVVNAKAWLQYSVLRVMHKPFEADFAALADLLEPDSLCLDVGANRGQSIDALKMLPFPVRIVAFEPQPERYRRLVKRFWKDYDVTVLPFGTSDEPSSTAAAWSGVVIVVSLAAGCSGWRYGDGAWIQRR